MRKLLTVHEMQDILQIKNDLAYKLIHTKGFPVIQLGRTYRIPEDKLKEWIDNYTGKEFKY